MQSYDHLSGAKNPNNLDAWWTSIASVALLLFKLEKLSDSCKIFWCSVAIRQDGLSSRQGRPNSWNSSISLRKWSTITKMSFTRTDRFCAVLIAVHQIFEIFQNFNIFQKPWDKHNSSYRIFPDLSLAQQQSTCIHLVGNQFSSKSHCWIASYDHFCTLAIPKMILTSTARLTPTARIILLSETDSRVY